MSLDANGFFTLLTESQEQKWSVINDGLERISAIIAGGAVDRSATPPVSPNDGEAYLVIGSATGDWSGHDHELALYINGGWVFIAPATDFVIWVADEDRFYKHTGAAWAAALGALAYDDYNLDDELGILAGTVSAPGLYIVGDSNTGLYQSGGADSLGVAIGGVRKAQFDAEGLIIGDDGPSADVALGLVINQGPNDGGAFALKSSDVVHAMTDLAEADTYFLVRKVDGNEGGASLEAYSEGSYAVRFRGVPTAAPAFNSTFSFGAVMFDALESDGGTGTQAIGDGDVIAVFRNEFDARATIMGNGDLWIDGQAKPDDGTKTLPSYSFNTDTDTGFYLAGAGILGFSVGDKAVMQVHSVGLAIYGPATAGTVPDGRLHVLTSSAGTVTAHANADDLVVERSTNGGISILTANGTRAALFLGDATDESSAKVFYTATGNAMTVGTDRASAVLRFVTAAETEAARIDSSQRVIVGNTASVTLAGVDSLLQVLSTGTASGSFARWSTTATQGANVFIGHSRGASVGSYTVLQDADRLGQLAFVGDDGSDLNTVGAVVRAIVNGTPVANRMPADLVFYTAAGASNDDVAEAGRFDKNKNLNLVGNLVLNNDTLDAAAADTVRLTSVDLSAGNTILAIDTEGSGIEAAGTASVDRTVAINVNGTVRYLLASDTPAA